MRFRKRFSSIAIIFIILSGNINSQSYIDRIGLYGIYGEAGYNSFRLAKVTNLFNEPLYHYSMYDVPIKTEKLFPNNAVFGLGIFGNPKDYLSLRIGLSYTNTSASFNYEDQQKLADIEAKVEAVSFNFSIRTKFRGDHFLIPFIDFGVGYNWSSCDMSSNIKIANEVDQQDNLKFSSNYFYLLPSIGVAHNFDLFEIYARAGYKILVIKRISQESNSATDIDLTGFFIMSGASIAF
jgi:hypothetical protein